MLWKKWSKKALVPALGLAVLAAGIPSAVMAKEQQGQNGQQGQQGQHDDQMQADPMKGVTVKSTEIVGMSAPVNAAQMADLYTTASVKVTYSDGTTKMFPLSYKKLFKSTDKVGGTIAGVAIDAKGNQIMDTSVADKPVPFVSDDPDSNSLMQIPGAKPVGNGNPLSLVTHYEYITSNNAGKSAYGLVPASMSLTSLDQNKTTGELTPVALKKIDFSAVGGLWIPCNGSLTPWNTHLGSEEYEPDARAFELDPKSGYTNPFAQAYYQDATKTGNPYAFGYLPEVTVNADNSTGVVKHYSMGRFSHELGKVAPDSRTVFFGDDGGNTMLFLYVADKAKDLSAGTLYAAKWVQKSADNGGSADLQWFKLGHAADSEIKAYVDQNLKFSDIFATSDKAADGYTAIKSYPTNKVEYLKVKPGMEKAAAFLEPRRYAATLGATAEFNKMEGVAVNSRDNKLYIAMSYMEKAMEKDAKGTDPADHIQLSKISAGVTYELSLGGGQKDTQGGSMESSYVPSFMQGLVVGEDLATPDAKGNKANDDKVANPDNLAYSDELHTLFIGEDSAMHANNYVWAYNVDTKKLSRILSLPAGAEATGLMSQDNLNGFAYIMSNIQHPGDEMITSDAYKADVEKLINQNFENKKSGVVGYISGVPTKAQMLAAKADDMKMVALRDAAAKAGAQLFLSFDGKDILVLNGTHTLIVRVGSKSATIDGEKVTISAAPEKIKGSIWVPAGMLNDFLDM